MRKKNAPNASVYATVLTHSVITPLPQERIAPMRRNNSQTNHTPNLLSLNTLQGSWEMLEGLVIVNTVPPLGSITLKPVNLRKIEELRDSPQGNVKSRLSPTLKTLANFLLIDPVKDGGSIQVEEFLNLPTPTTKII